jgi:rod shape-determining protein MreC
MMYILLAIVLMLMDQRGRYVPSIRSFMELAVEPVFHVAGWPAKAWESLGEKSRARSELIAENETLRQRLLETSGALQVQAALQQENIRLRNLLDATRGRDYSFQFAEMQRVDLDPFAHKVWIDRGGDEGVFVGQAVIDGLGIVGQVEDVHRHFSTVRLISDPDHALPVQINRTGLRTVAFGSGETSQLLMPNVPLQADVSPGDMIVTSGLGDRFPPGFPVGEVIRVSRESGETFATVYLRPFAALDRGREVLLIEPLQANGAPETGQPAADAPANAQPDAGKTDIEKPAAEET